jgi:methyltransferase (TIGR00027 family)
MSAAASRSAHLLVDREPFIFEDRLAGRLLDEQGEAMIPYHRASGSHPVLAGTRLAVTVRSRYAEDQLAAAVARGIDQYVILGAGLDSFAYRSPLASRLHVFELDAPATQEWKRDRLLSASIEALGEVEFVPIDLRTEPVLDRLTAAGFSAARPAFVSWLGVSFYLDEQDIQKTLGALGALAPGSELVMDYVLTPELRDAEGEIYAGFAKPVAAQSGEPWLSELSPDHMAELLTEAGFSVVEQRGQRNAIDALLWDRSDVLKPSELWMIARALVWSPSPMRN